MQPKLKRPISPWMFGNATLTLICIALALVGLGQSFTEGAQDYSEKRKQDKYFAQLEDDKELLDKARKAQLNGGEAVWPDGPITLTLNLVNCLNDEWQNQPIIFSAEQLGRLHFNSNKTTPRPSATVTDAAGIVLASLNPETQRIEGAIYCPAQN